MNRFRGGRDFKAHRLVYHSNLGSRIIKKTSLRCERSTASDVMCPWLSALTANRYVQSKYRRVQKFVPGTSANRCVFEKRVGANREDVREVVEPDARVRGEPPHHQRLVIPEHTRGFHQKSTCISARVSSKVQCEGFIKRQLASHN